VLPQDDPAVGRVEHVRAEVPVGQQPEQRGGQHRERDQDQDRGEEDVPGEDGHSEHRHAGSAHADDRGDEVDRAEDGAQPGDEQAGDPQIGTRPG
jgi:hypothetical protein